MKNVMNRNSRLSSLVLIVLIAAVKGRVNGLVRAVRKRFAPVVTDGMCPLQRSLCESTRQSG